MRTLGVVVVAVCLGGCASTRLMHRDGCWVRQTESWPNRIQEEMGPCSRPEPKWSEDRVARLTQECMAQADYRWQNRALAAWSRNEPLPPQPDEQELLRTCMTEASGYVIAENEGLKRRLAELSADREALRTVVREDRQHLMSSHDRIASALGEAAKKPAPNAVATATSSGTATTHSDVQSRTPNVPAPTLTVIPGGPASAVCTAPPAQPERKVTASAPRPPSKAPRKSLAELCEQREKELASNGARAQEAKTSEPAKPEAP